MSDSRNNPPTRLRSAAVPATAIVTFVLCAGLARILTPMPSEQAYLAWPIAVAVAALVHRRIIGRPWLTPRSGGAVLCGGLGLAWLGILDGMAGPVPGNLMRLAWCGLGWFLLLTLLRSGFMWLWQRCTAGAPVSRRTWIPQVLWLALIVAWLPPALLSYMQIHPPKRYPAGDPGLPCQEVSFRSRDGSTLRGWYVPAPGAQRAAVLLHGVMDHRGGVLPFVEILHAGGYNVLTFDLRGHGHSDGWTVTYGAREKDDILAALDYLDRHHATEARRVVGVGWSMGAACLILAAAEDLRLEALHLDAPYASTSDMAWHIGHDMPRWQAWWMYWLGTSLGCLESGANLFTLAPADQVARLAPRPVMIVHGDRDQVVPIEQGRKVYDAARQPKSFHVVQGAGHCATLALEGRRYADRMLEFLNAALAD